VDSSPTAFSITVPGPKTQRNGPLEAAYCKADTAIDEIIRYSKLPK
jgi:hypothetical protein